MGTGSPTEVGPVAATPSAGARGYRVARDENDYELAGELGAHAMRYARELQTPPLPESYELLYHHAAGYDQALSNAIADTVHQHGGLPHHHADRLYEAHLSPNRHVAPLRHALSQCASELGDVLAKAQHGTSEFQISVQDADIDRAFEQGPEATAAVIRDLLRASNAVTRQTRELEKDLAASIEEVNHLARQITTVKSNAERDPLTRLPTRRALHIALAKALPKAHEQDQPLCLLLVDLDGFRAYNRAHGRSIGDKILRIVAERISSRIADGHMVARYAGDQFAVLLTDTSLESAVRLAELMRADMLGLKFVRKASGRSAGCVTISIGVALSGYDDTQEALIDRADDALSAAKRLGRNRVRSAANAKTHLGPTASIPSTSPTSARPQGRARD